MKSMVFRKQVIIALALTLLVLPVSRGWAQVGPQQPPAPPPTEPIKDKLKNSFRKFFTPNADDSDTTDKPQKKAGDQPESNFDKPHSKKNNQNIPFTPDPRRPETWGNDPSYGDKKPNKPSDDKRQAEEAPKRPPLLTQPPLSTVKIDDPQIDPKRPPKPLQRLDDPANPLGYADAVRQIKNVEKLIQEKRLVEARTQLVPLRQWLIDCTEAHINLYNTLNKVPSARAQSELEKELALEFAMLRDRAMFVLGTLYVEEKDYKKAVKELVEVIKSQPKSKTGILSYELLQEIGFTEQLQLTPPEGESKSAPSSNTP